MGQSIDNQRQCLLLSMVKVRRKNDIAFSITARALKIIPA